MATDTVTNGGDDPNVVGSLRYELAHAQAGDVVNFAPGVTAVSLGSTLTIAQNVTIEGGSGVTITGGGASGGFSDFTIAKGASAAFDGLTISGGAFVGQDQTNAATSPTQGGSGGGAITDYGTLTLSHSTISDNSAVGGAGSVASYVHYYKGGGAGGSAAGGIYVAAGARLDLVGRTNRFARNSATGGDGGQGGYSNYASGGFGGAGAHAKTLYARGPSNNRMGGHGRRGDTSNLAIGNSRGAGRGGRGGMNGQDGRLYRVGRYYAPYTGIGTGGGGGGGNAFSDFGGAGTVRHVTAAQTAPATLSTVTARSAVATTSAVVCFAAGTLIRTVRGDVRVEALVPGDLVVTASGAHRPVRWLGHRTIDCGRHPRPDEVLPVRIAAHAFGEGRPARTLLVSPGHAICVDVGGEVLIPALALANGTTITRAVVDTIAYWHVELDSHDILLAEGLPAESYFEMGNRAFFTESTVVQVGAVSPDGTGAPRSHADFCRPFASDGPVVEAVRRQLAAAAARRGRQPVGLSRAEAKV